MTITMINVHDLGDVAGILRRQADRREAELDAAWSGMFELTEARSYVRNLRDAADYHERQAVRRKQIIS